MTGIGMRIKFTRDAHGRGAGTVEDVNPPVGRYLVAAGDAVEAPDESLVLIRPADMEPPVNRMTRAPRRRKGA